MYNGSEIAEIGCEAGIGCDLYNGIIQTVKYADDLVLMAKEKTVLQSMIDKLIATGRYYGMEMNVEKQK